MGREQFTCKSMPGKHLDNMHVSNAVPTALLDPFLLRICLVNPSYLQDGMDFRLLDF